VIINNFGVQRARQVEAKSKLEGDGYMSVGYVDKGDREDKDTTRHGDDDRMTMQ